MSRERNAQAQSGDVGIEGEVGVGHLADVSVGITVDTDHIDLTAAHHTARALHDVLRIAIFGFKPRAGDGQAGVDNGNAPRGKRKFHPAFEFLTAVGGEVIGSQVGLHVVRQHRHVGLPRKRIAVDGRGIVTLIGVGGIDGHLAETRCHVFFEISQRQAVAPP